MANIINYNGNRSLQLTTSECIYRNVDIPQGTTDIRFGMCMTYLGSSNQTFNSIASRFETMRMMFTGTPSPDPVTYFGIGSDIGAYSLSVSNVYPSNKTSIRSTSNSIIKSSNITNSLTRTPTPIYLADIGVDEIVEYGRGMFIMIRLYKNLDNTFEFECRHSSAADLTSMTDPQFRNLITDTSLSEVMSTATFQNDGVNLFDTVKGVFFSWPFFNVPLTITTMGYRAI